MLPGSAAAAAACSAAVARRCARWSECSVLPAVPLSAPARMTGRPVVQARLPQGWRSRPLIRGSGVCVLSLSLPGLAWAPAGQRLQPTFSDSPLPEFNSLLVGPSVYSTSWLCPSSCLHGTYACIRSYVLEPCVCLLLYSTHVCRYVHKAGVYGTVRMYSSHISMFPLLRIPVVAHASRPHSRPPLSLSLDHVAVEL